MTPTVQLDKLENFTNTQDQARGVEGPEPGPATGGREDREEGGEGVEEGEGEGGGQESAVGDRVEEGSNGEGTGEGSEREGGKQGREADEQDLHAEQQQEGGGEGRPRVKRARGVRYGEEQQGREEQGAVWEGMTVYGPHKVSGKWRRYVGTVEEMIEQQDRKGHVTRAAIVQWEDQGEGDEERLPYPVERLKVCPQGREMQIHGQLVPEQEARELEGEEVSTGGKNKKRKRQLMKRGAAGKKKKEARRRQGGRSKGEKKGTTDNWDLRVDGEGRWQRMKLYTHNDPAALYRADKAAWQQMKLHEADPDVVAYQEIRLQGKDNVVCAQMYDREGREYQREWAQVVPLLVRRGLSVVQDKKVGARGRRAVYDVATEHGQAVIINCHVPHGRRVKEYVAQLRMEYIRALERGPVIVVGDFNYDPRRRGAKTEVHREVRKFVEEMRLQDVSYSGAPGPSHYPAPEGSAPSRIDAVYADPSLVLRFDV